MTIVLPASLIDRAKNAVFWTPGLTLADLAIDGIELSLAKVERKNGGPFPRRKGDLKGGRPVK
jgi:hypothetical protein